jgi:hypothetical protein
MKLIQFGVRNDYGKEYYMTLCTGKRYSLFQAAIDVGELSKWNEPPYIQISSGYGKLFSFLFTISKFGFCFDLFGRNWRDELFYSQPNEITKD